MEALAPRGVGGYSCGGTTGNARGAPLENLQMVPSSYFKKLVGTEEMWECRIQFASNAYRLFCFFVDDSVVLTHGFLKKSQKAPVHEIERGEAYRREFLERGKKHE